MRHSCLRSPPVGGPSNDEVRRDGDPVASPIQDTTAQVDHIAITTAKNLKFEKKTKRVSILTILYISTTLWIFFPYFSTSKTNPA